MDIRERIELNPDVLAGKPIVKGTRIAVEHVLDMLAAGVDVLAQAGREARVLLTMDEDFGGLPFAQIFPPRVASSCFGSRRCRPRSPAMRGRCFEKEPITAGSSLSSNRIAFDIGR